MQTEKGLQNAFLADVHVCIREEYKTQLNVTYKPMYHLALLIIIRNQQLHNFQKCVKLQGEQDFQTKYKRTEKNGE